MESSYIEAEQLLFGYSNGHHLLATSILLTERTKKNMEVLSDLSGPDIQSGFTEYITGYPLENENYYALCKTWYAPEMKRPGCVWTHMLLFKYKDLIKIKNCRDLLDLFVRPSIEVDKNIYSEQIKIHYYKDVRVNLDISIDKLRFIEWSVYTNNEPIIIPADTATDYLYEIYRFWENQDEFFMRTFSFCTGVLANRNIEKKVIDLQVVPYNLLRSISRQNKQAKVVDVLPKKVKYPLWIDYMLNENRPDIISEFNKFRSYFGSEYLNKQYFSKFASLYINIGVIDGTAKLSEFLDYVSEIFLEEDASLIKNITVQQLFKSEHLKWFGYKSMVNVLLDLLIRINLYGLDINCILIDEIIDMLWRDYPDKLEYVFEKLINNKLNLLGEKFIKEFALETSSEKLPEFTNMNLGLCNLMVRLDCKFALCSQIWHQSKDFQLEIINCIEIDDRNIKLAKQIVTTILENTSFDLWNPIYKKFGDLAITTVLDWYCITQASENTKEKWMRICNKKPAECVKWMMGVDKLEDISLIIRIISILDPFSNEVIRVDKSFWTDIFYNLNINQLSAASKFILAQFFMPIILLKKGLFPNDFVRFSFGIIYNKIAEQKFDYQNWERLEKLLPELEWYSSWDKCKRLRKAMNQKGYKTLEIFSSYI